MDRAYRIRAAVANDVEAILALDRQIATVPHWGTADYVAALSPSDRKGGLNGLHRCLFVAESRSHVVGFAVGKVADVTAEIESVAVAETARRSGIGRELCSMVMQWARDLDATAIELEVRTRSSGPISLYRSLGFIAQGRRTRYYRDPDDDAILMRLSLPPSATPRART